MNLTDHIRVVWRKKLLILAVSVAAALGTYFFFASQPKVYQASAQLGVIAGASIVSGPLSQSDTLFLADTYAQLGTTVPVIQSAIKDGHLDGVSVAEALKRLKVSASSSAAFLTVTGTGPTPAQAVDLVAGDATALGQAVTAQQERALSAQLATLDAQLAQLNAQIASAPNGSPAQAALQAQAQGLEQVIGARESAPLDQVTLVSPARAAAGPVSPRPTRDAALAFITALVVVAELMVILEYLSDRLPAEGLEEALNRETGLPVLAHIPQDDEAGIAEASRMVRTSLLFTDEVSNLRSFAIVSSEPGAGKSFVAEHLALALSSMGVGAVLVDGDTRRPVLHDRLGLPRSPGLTDLLSGPWTPAALHPVPGVAGLELIPSGPALADPSGAITAALGGRVISALGSGPGAARSGGPEGVEFNVVIVDSPPEGLFPDALSIAAQCDGTILVVDRQQSRFRQLSAMVRRLRSVGAHPLGIVVNRSAEGRSRGYYYGAYSRRARLGIGRPADAARAVSLPPRADRGGSAQPAAPAPAPDPAPFNAGLEGGHPLPGAGDQRLA